MIIGLFDRKAKNYQIAGIDEATCEKTVLGTVNTKDARDYAVFQAEYPNVYTAAKKVFGDAFETNKRLLRAAQMFTNGTVPTQVDAATWLVRSQSHTDDGTVYRVSFVDHRWLCTCDDATAGNLPWCVKAQSELCKHSALVLLSYEL